MFPRLLLSNLFTPVAKQGRETQARIFMVLAILLALLITVVACTREASLPPPPKDIPFVAEPGFRRDIQPILDEFCVKCHSPADAHYNLRLDSYDGLVRGSDDGPVIIPGDTTNSILLAVIKHLEPPGMPFHGEPLTPNRIAALETWVRHGAPDN